MPVATFENVTQTSYFDEWLTCHGICPLEFIKMTYAQVLFQIYKWQAAYVILRILQIVAYPINATLQTSVGDQCKTSNILENNYKLKATIETP